MQICIKNNFAQKKKKRKRKKKTNVPQLPPLKTFHGFPRMTFVPSENMKMFQIKKKFQNTKCFMQICIKNNFAQKKKKKKKQMFPNFLL